MCDDLANPLSAKHWVQRCMPPVHEDHPGCGCSPFVVYPLADFRQPCRVSQKTELFSKCLFLLPAQSLQSCLTLCDPLDCRPPGSSVHGILQSRILEWVAMPFSGGSSSSRDQTCLLCLLHCMWIFLPTGPPGKPFFLLKDNKNFPLLDTIVVAVVQLLSCVPFFRNSMDCSRQAPLS